MKKILSALSLIASAAMLSGCFTAPTTGTNDLAKRYFDAWVATHYPNNPTTALGSVVISDVTGTGSLLGDEETTPYIYCTHLSTDLEGNIASTTEARIAQQLGTFSETAYYGPYVINRSQASLAAGINDILETMRVGGTRTCAVPGWLLSGDYYDTPEEYLANCKGSDAIYTFTVKEAIHDIVQWEIDSVERYVTRHYDDIDSTYYGWYYIQTTPPIDTTSFTGDQDVYVNYTGTLLNGLVFDTSVADTAKRHHLYSSSKTYEPVALSLPSSESDLVAFSSSNSETTEGFSKCVMRMRAGEKGICIFYSGLGYKSASQGESIPPFSPLIFEMHMLGVNKDGSIPENTLDKDSDE